MVKTGSKFSKEEVYKFAKDVEKFLQLLNGIVIQAEDGKLQEIENQKYKLETLVSKFTPTIYEEYSNKAKYAYRAMIEAKIEYERVISSKCSNKAIESALEQYKDKVEEYNMRKEYRDKLKEIV